jgi:hypothetical protein
MPLAGQPVCLTGMHPDEPEIAFRLPAPPRIEITVEGERAAAPTLLSNLVISPTEKKLTAVYCAKTRGLRRVFIPGIHKHIPISVTVDGDAPIHYEAPVPLRDRLLAASPPAGSSGGQPLLA